jgi:hypothetical protein
MLRSSHDSVFESLPTELLFRLCSNLDAEELAAMAVVCQRFSSVCLDDRLWQGLCQREDGFQSHTNPEDEDAPPFGNRSWRDCYAEYRRGYSGPPILQIDKGIRLPTVVDVDVIGCGGVGKVRHPLAHHFIPVSALTC